MSREIKFRAWDKNTNEWIVGELENHKSLTLSKHSHSSEWQQYTGLKDKNGREIYEGDKLTNSSDAPLTVGWDDKYACFTAIDTEDGTDYGLLGNCEPQNYEVTGNVWES